jgi:plasmid stabilization system protein ParE
MLISFHPEAIREYELAIDYYESCQLGLGKQLVQEVDASIKLILAFPKAWTELQTNIRRILVRRFPFGLLYIAKDNEIQVLAVMHLNRKPDYWKNRT